MKLDAKLIDIASNLCALRFVFLEPPLDVGQTGLSLRAFNGAVGNFRNDGGLPALLAGESHARRGTVHDQRRRAMGTCESYVANARGDSRSGIVHNAWEKQETYRQSRVVGPEQA
jgi:hypothetical protein